TGTIHEHVDLAKPVLDLCHPTCHGRGVPHVEPHRHRAASDSLEGGTCLVEQARGSRGNRNRCACGAERERVRLAKPFTAARYQGDTSFELKAIGITRTITQCDSHRSGGCAACVSLKS